MERREHVSRVGKRCWASHGSLKERKICVIFGRNTIKRMKRSASARVVSECPVGGRSKGVVLSLVNAHERVVAVLIVKRIVGGNGLHVDRLPVFRLW